MRQCVRRFRHSHKNSHTHTVERYKVRRPTDMFPFCSFSSSSFSSAIPITFTQPLKHVKADEGISVTLRCELSKAGIAAEWMKGDDLLKNGIKHQIRRRETTQEMLLWRPGPGDSGMYSCVCAGQKTSATVTIVGEEEGEVMLIALNGGRPYHNGLRFHGSTKAVQVKCMPFGVMVLCILCYCIYL